MSEASQPIIIIGAGRSGTKLLRRILNSAPGTAAFPREINYIWRYGNATFPTDELGPEHARPDVVAYVRKRFRLWREKHDQARVIEKTCANSLRVRFVEEIFPEAHFVHLIRDGRAVAESARRRWTASPGLFYLLEKFRWVPIRDMPYYFVRFLSYQWGRVSNPQDAVSSWGPRFEGMDRMVNEWPLLEVCAAQWKACVQTSSQALKATDQARVSWIKYEDLVRNPASSVENLFGELDLEYNADCANYVSGQISSAHMDKWQDQLTAEEIDRVLDVIGEELVNQGYLMPDELKGLEDVG